MALADLYRQSSLFQDPPTGDDPPQGDPPTGLSALGINPSTLGRYAGEEIAARLAGWTPQQALRPEIEAYGEGFFDRAVAAQDEGRLLIGRREIAPEQAYDVTGALAAPQAERRAQMLQAAEAQVAAAKARSDEAMRLHFLTQTGADAAQLFAGRAVARPETMGAAMNARQATRGAEADMKTSAITASANDKYQAELARIQEQQRVARANATLPEQQQAEDLRALGAYGTAAEAARAVEASNAEYVQGAVQEGTKNAGSRRREDETRARNAELARAARRREAQADAALAQRRVEEMNRVAERRAVAARAAAQSGQGGAGSPGRAVYAASVTALDEAIAAQRVLLDATDDSKKKAVIRGAIAGYERQRATDAVKAGMGARTAPGTVQPSNGPYGTVPGGVTGSAYLDGGLAQPGPQTPAARRAYVIATAHGAERAYDYLEDEVGAGRLTQADAISISAGIQ